MFLSIGKIGHERLSTILEDLENWLEFATSADFCDLQAGPSFSTDSARDVIVGAVQFATHIVVHYLIFFDIAVKKSIPLMYIMSI